MRIAAFGHLHLESMLPAHPLSKHRRLFQKYFTSQTLIRQWLSWNVTLVPLSVLLGFLVIESQNKQLIGLRPQLFTVTSKQRLKQDSSQQRTSSNSCSNSSTTTTTLIKGKLFKTQRNVFFQVNNMVKRFQLREAALLTGAKGKTFKTTLQVLHLSQ